MADIPTRETSKADAVHVNDAETGKAEAIHVNDAEAPSSQEMEPSDFGFSAAEQKKIIQTVDRRLVIILGLLYCVSLMDRLNLSLAHVAGMAKELVLIENRFVCKERKKKKKKETPALNAIKKKSKKK